MMSTEFMSLFFYEQWYKNDVSPNLDDETKLKLAKKISAISLQVPIYMSGHSFPEKDFPELIPFSHTEDFTGMQLYVVLTEIMKERGANVLSASEICNRKVK